MHSYGVEVSPLHHRAPSKKYKYILRQKQIDTLSLFDNINKTYIGTSKTRKT